MTLYLTTSPVKAEILALLSVADMKLNLRISHSVEDALIEQNILSAYDWLAGEFGWLNRSVLETTWTLTLPAFVTSVELPRSPAMSLTSFKYLVDGVETTVDPALYKFRKTGDYGFGFINRVSGATWPTDGDVDPDRVSIVYKAGMADGTGLGVRAKHPALHKAMALLAGDYFRIREDTFTDIRMVEIDRKVVNGVNRVAGRYRIVNNHG